MSYRYMNIRRCKKFVTKPQDEWMNTRRIQDQTFHDSLLDKECKSWFTVIPLDDINVAPENIRVKFNPLSYSLIIKLKLTRSQTCFIDPRYRRDIDICKPMKYVVNLPKDIRMDKLQVKFTQHGELVIYAPLKYPQLQQTWSMNEETLNSRFLREKNLGNEICWINLPIIGYSRIGFNKIRGTGTNILPFKRETCRMSECEDSDVTITSDEDMSENEWTRTHEEEEEDGERYVGDLGEMKVLVERYVDLLNKIFYPNIVQVKIRPLHPSTMRGRKYLKNLQLICRIQLNEFHTEDVRIHLDILHGEKVLIIEGKNIHECSTLGLRCVKDIRYIIPLPLFFNVDKVVYNVLSNGVLNMKLPIVSMKREDFNGFYETLDKKYVDECVKCHY